MSKYVIHLSTECISYPSNDYGYWTGKTYTVNKEKFPICEELINERIKRYSSLNRANAMGEKLHEKCPYVEKWTVEEIE